MYSDPVLSIPPYLFTSFYYMIAAVGLIAKFGTTPGICGPFGGANG
jgi:hypothetical protein